MKPHLSKSPVIAKTNLAKRFIRNAAKSITHTATLKQVLFAKINRHEPKAPVVKGKTSDFSDAKHYEKFTGHSTHYSSRNFI